MTDNKAVTKGKMLLGSLGINNHNEELEGQVLGGLVNYPALFPLDITPEDFAIAENQLLFKIMLTLVSNGKSITKTSIEKSPELKKENVWIVNKIIDTWQKVSEDDVRTNASAIKDLSKRRQLANLAVGLITRLQNTETFNDINTDHFISELTTLQNSTTNRAIRCSNVRKDDIIPPTYDITVEVIGTDKKADIHFDEGELYQRSIFKNKIADTLGIVPVVPKEKYDTFINDLISSATVIPAPEDASYKEVIFDGVMEFLKTTVKATTEDDIRYGYLTDKIGNNIFVGISGAALHDYLDNKRRAKISQRELWQLLKMKGAIGGADKRAPRPRIKGIDEKTGKETGKEIQVRLWWIPFNKLPSDIKRHIDIDEINEKQIPLNNMSFSDDGMEWL